VARSVPRLPAAARLARPLRTGLTCAFTLLLAACSAPASKRPRADAAATARIEAIAKDEQPYSRLPDGRVRLPSRGEFELDHEDSRNLYVRIYPAARSALRAEDATGAGSPSFVVPSGNRLVAVDIGDGLPRAGQWRDRFAVGDAVGDGTVQAVFTPPRKSGGTPLAFRRIGLRWERAALNIPAGPWDYGGVAIADVDGDGRNDLLLGMHLTGFSALLARGDGYERRDDGLPQRARHDFAGSGYALAALPAAAGSPADVILLREAPGTLPTDRVAPGLATYRWSSTRFTATPIADGRITGRDLAFAASHGDCPAKLAVASDAAAPAFIFERTGDGSWQARGLDGILTGYMTTDTVSLAASELARCGALAVSYRVLEGQRWHVRLDLLLDDGNAWRRVPLFDRDTRTAITATTFVASTERSPPRLIAIDAEGTMRVFDLADDTPSLVYEAIAPDWRRGCAGSDVHVLDTSDDGRFSAIAGFAGEPTMTRFDRCRAGGGVDAWRFEPTSAPPPAGR
jgi:hypothetical protein